MVLTRGIHRKRENNRLDLGFDRWEQKGFGENWEQETGYCTANPSKQERIAISLGIRVVLSKMLQWMGGSRRKVTTSRKSIQNRQKQYFDQRKRQQQTTELENCANERTKYAHEQRSLDILSLTNLATVAQDHGSVHTINARENPETSDRQENFHVLRCSPDIPVNRNTPGDSSNLNEETVKSTCHKAETILPKRVSVTIDHVNAPSTPKYTKASKPDAWDASSKNQLSVLDLLGDDGFSGCSEQRSAHEAHVAFSVEGLGLMGMETPVHSPRLSDSRVSFNGCYEPPGASRRVHSSKNTTKVTDDFEIKLNGNIDDIEQFHSPPSVPINLRVMPDQDIIGNSRSTQPTLERCVPLSAFNCTMDNFLGEETDFWRNMDRNEEKWNARLSFLDDDLFDERKDGKAWRNQPFQVGSDSDYFLGARKYEMSDYGLQDSYLLKERDAEPDWDELNISESPRQCCKHFTSGKEYDFLTLQEERYPVVRSSSDFRSISNQPLWSPLATKDEGDDVSLLSEESCSSSAVRGKKIKKSASNLMKKLKLSTKSHGNEHWKSLGDNVQNLFAKEMLHAKLDGPHEEKNLKGAGHCMRTPSFLRSRNSSYMKELSKVQRVSEPTESMLFEEQHTSVSMDLDLRLSPLHGTCGGIDNTSLQYMFCSEPPFDSFLVPELFPDTGLSHKRSKSKKPFDHAPYGRLFSEKAVAKSPMDPVSYDSDIFSSTKLWEPDPPTPEAEAKPPYSSSVSDLQKDIGIPGLSGQHSVNGDGDELRSQSADCMQDMKEPQNEVSVKNSVFPLGNQKAVVVADFKDSCSKSENMKDGKPERTESPKGGISSEAADEPSSARKENAVKLESCINDKKCNNESGNTVQYRSTDKGTVNSESVRINIEKKALCTRNQSYGVMLESYVLQLLCVQKVLMEAS
ncbi:hypothetical protein AAC387_Pa01g0830 [Persea americana]